jgi:hypothetical protein
MRWILIVLVLCLGCGPTVPKVETPSKYKLGDVVYHKLDDRKMVVVYEYYGDCWDVRYFDDIGQIHQQRVLGLELVETPPIGADE